MTGQRVCIGTIVGVHGLDGTIKVRSEISNPDLLASVESVTLVTKAHELKEEKVSSLKLESSGLTMKLKEYSDRTVAEALVGSIVYADRAQLGALEEDEWWVKDLIGLDVYTSNGAHVGTVCDVISGANQLLEIRKLKGGKNDTALVPFVKALVPVVDIKQRRLEISDLPGLID